MWRKDVRWLESRDGKRAEIVAPTGAPLVCAPNSVRSTIRFTTHSAPDMSQELPPSRGQGLASGKRGKPFLWLMLGGVLLGFLGLAAGVAAWFFGAHGAESGTGPKGEALPTGSSNACPRATACCKLLMETSSGDPTSLATCNGLAGVPPSACEQALATYKRSASLLGLSCE